MPRKPGGSNKPKKRARVENYGHEATRPNIPTGEQSRLSEDKPEPILYPRDTSLDPQLVWKGKDDQDREPLEVPSVPIYIQETIQPKAIIENLRARADASYQVPNLFADLTGLEQEDPAKKMDFYRHAERWRNRMILGDSLMVMTSLAEREALKGRVQCIYMDPPYGIKFGSNWQVSTRKRDVKDNNVKDVSRQPEQIKAFRDTWELGIHSYLAYLRDRLVVARELLTESGSIFVQIGDENVHLVRCLMDEVFGNENFLSLVVFKTSGGLGTDLIKSVTDYVIWYAKERKSAKYHKFTSYAVA